MSEIFLQKPERTLETKICESCGKDFSCGANAGKCWCFEVDLKKETLAKLQEDFKSCLCQDCLISHKSARIDTKGSGNKQEIREISCNSWKNLVYGKKEK